MSNGQRLAAWRVSACRLLALAGLFIGPAAMAQPATADAKPAGAAVPTETFFRLPQFSGARLNPGATGATHVAFMREIKGRVNLLVMDVATRQIVNVAAYDSADIIDFEWISSDRLMYTVSETGGGQYDGGARHGVFAIERDGSRPLTLSEGLASYSGTVGTGNRGLPARGAFLQRVRSGDPNEFIAAVYSNSPYGISYTRVNSRNGVRTPIDAGGLGNLIEAAFDNNDVLRAAATLDKTTVRVHVRESASAPWREVAQYDQHDGSGFVPLRFDGQGALYVQARVAGRDTAAIYRFDWAAGKPEAEPTISVKGFDIEKGLIFGPDESTLIGVRYEAETQGTYWIDPQFRALQESIDAQLPGRVNTLSGNRNKTMLVASVADTSPARYYLYDVKSQRLLLLGNSRPWIDEKTQSRSDMVRYPARDGLSIPALLTLPRGVPAKGLPLVLLAHGGPFVRGINWNWNRERQFLASRGYAVLEPDFRGSTGHGWALFRAGWKQWGLSMQDDLADGVAELVKRGIVDGDRVCIAGASYGGYAVVMGLIRHPEVYKCGISWVGVTDIELLYTVGWSDTAGSEWARYGMPVLVGDREKDKAQLLATSAVAQAARLKAPLLLAYGREDVRVPYDHGRQLRDAVAPYNKRVQYIEYPDEGHGWRLPATNLDFWGRAEKLLAETIGTPRP